MPTVPSHHGCAASQAIVSSPSSASFTDGSKSPSEPNRPRTSCATTAKPAAATVVGLK